MTGGGAYKVRATLPIRLKCKCGKVLKVPVKMLNRQGRCPSCNRCYRFLPAKGQESLSPESSQAASPFRMRAPTPTEQRKELDLYVGLDYGTSTVKCIVRADVRGPNRRPETFYHVVPIEGQLLFPSVLWQEGTRIHIGEPSSRANGLRPFRSAKACLRCIALEGETCSLCARGKYAETSLDAGLVSWVIVSHCANCIREWIKKKFPEKEYAYDWSHVEWKMGAPLDGFKQISLRELFADTLWRAVHGGTGVSPTMRLDDAMSAFDAIRDTHCPPETETRCLVRPEAIVAVTAFLESRQYRPPQSGLYYICDAGAGTLDVAFFRYSPEATRDIACYETSCTRVGGDSFAAVLARHVAKLDGCSFEDAFNDAVRALPDGGADVIGEYGSEGYVATELGKVRRRMRLGRNAAFAKSRNKERLWEHWKNLRAVVIGGARHLPGVVDAVTAQIEGGHPQNHIRPKHYEFDFSHIKEATELHGIAYGLAIPAANYPEYWQPSEVEPLDDGPLGTSPSPMIGEDPHRMTG